MSKKKNNNQKNQDLCWSIWESSDKDHFLPQLLTISTFRDLTGIILKFPSLPVPPSPISQNTHLIDGKSKVLISVMPSLEESHEYGILC